MILPASKQQLLEILLGSTIPDKDVLITGLGVLTRDAAGLQLFCARLIVRPAVLTTAYALAVILGGSASWLWLVAAIVGSLGAFLDTPAKLIDLPEYERLTRPKQLLLTWGSELAEVAWVICWGAIWLRMVLYSGLFSLYESTWVQFKLLGLGFSLVSLVFGWFFSRHMNALFLFVAGARSRRR